MVWPVRGSSTTLELAKRKVVFVVEFTQKPIVRGINPHTGLPDGDDSGYRNVPVCPEDDQNPDPLVDVTKYGIKAVPVYAIGSVPGLCPFYNNGLGSQPKVLVRRPLALVEANQLLEPYNRELVALDGWRSVQVQALLWVYIRNQMMRGEGIKNPNLSIAEEIRIGLKADEVGSYAPVLQDDAYKLAAETLLSERRDQIQQAIDLLHIPEAEVVNLYLTFRGNHGVDGLRLDTTALTAHGGGGAIDMYTISTRTGLFTNMGVPFDYVPPHGTQINAAVMDYFDMPQVDVKEYRRMVETDPVLQRYLRELGINEVTERVFREAQTERRIMFHTIEELHGSYYSLRIESGENWHAQFGNTRGGNQAHLYPNSGNSCHARLKGLPVANWGNAAAHRMAAAMGY